MGAELEEKLALLEEEVSMLHGTLRKMGKNTRTETDIFGRRFAVPVDKEHKATEDPLGVTLMSCANPHMRAFHTSWFGFFASFYSTFAAAALNPYIKPDIGMSASEWGLGNTASIAGTIFFRLAMGWICDKFGARRGLGLLLLGTIPAIGLMALAQSAWQIVVLRCVIGCSLATFVACQAWCSMMFAKQVVGIANATAAGWGNLGGGVTNLTMPLVFILMMSFTGNDPSLAWRLCYIVPALFHLFGGLVVLTARDLPDGNFKQLEAIGAKQPSKSSTVLKVGFSNVNAWIFTLTYGFCFGVELTMNNVAARYFYKYQGLTPVVSGIAASMWGLMNLFARSIGGYLSDWSAKKWGLRGRLWSCWAVQTLEGVFCIILGSITIGMDAPHASSVGGRTEQAWAFLGDDRVRAKVGMPSGWVNLNSTCYGQTTLPLTMKACDTVTRALDKGLRECLMVGDSTSEILFQTAPAAKGGPADLNCISNSGTVGQVMVMIVFFSGCVQAAEGLHYGIVPYISRTALGVVSGMVGAGGNLGAVITLQIFFQGAFRTDAGIMNMGYLIIGVTFLHQFMYFPGEDSQTSGGMWFKGRLGGYDPQLIKPPADYRGADVMDYAAAKAALAGGAENTAAPNARPNVPRSTPSTATVMPMTVVEDFAH